MPIFSYKAIGRDQLQIEGQIESDSAPQARRELRSQGIRVIKLVLDAQSRRKSGRSLLAYLPRRSWNQWLAGFSGELATLVSVGIPLIDALGTLEEQYRGRAKSIVLHLKDQISSGKSIAEAMRGQPDVFDKLSLKMIEVGQNTGNLDEILRQVSDFKRRSHEFKDRVLSAILYPAIILAVSVGVSIFLMTVVVPMLLENLVEAGKSLPWPTQVLQVGSHVLTHYGLLILGTVASFVVVVFAYVKTENGKRLRDTWMLKVPLLGSMGRQQEISRISLVVATLMRSGVDFLESIEIAKGTTKNVLLVKALEDCAIQVTAGKDIGKAMKSSLYFPPLVTQIFSVGQQSGKLEEMLFQLSADYDRQVESTSRRLATVIEPALILLLSGLIGFIMFATLMPMMEAGNVL